VTIIIVALQYGLFVKSDMSDHEDALIYIQHGRICVKITDYPNGINGEKLYTTLEWVIETRSVLGNKLFNVEV